MELFKGFVNTEGGMVVCTACMREIPTKDADLIDTGRGVMVVCLDADKCEEGE